MFVFLSGKRVAPYTYTSHKGGDVTIKCDLKFTESQLGKGYTIKWTKNHDIVFSNLKSSNVVTSSGITERVEIVNGTSLKISRLQIQDGTYYRCHVKLFREGIKTGKWLLLKVNSKLDNHL